MSSKFKVNKDDRNITDIQQDITQDSKMNSIERHLAEKIYNSLYKSSCLSWAFDNMKFIDLGVVNKEKFLNLAKEILGEEKLNDNSREN